jgi:hypothetical protein
MKPTRERAYIVALPWRISYDSRTEYLCNRANIYMSSIIIRSCDIIFAFGTKKISFWFVSPPRGSNSQPSDSDTLHS